MISWLQDLFPSYWTEDRPEATVRTLDPCLNQINLDQDLGLLFSRSAAKTDVPKS